MGSLISLLIGAGVPQRLAKPVLIALGVVLLIGALGLGKCAYDRNLIATHDAKQSETIAVQGRAGEAVAADERRTDDARIQNETEEVKNATQSIPDRPVSDRQHARACVILRQQARTTGQPVPAGC